MEVKQIYDFVNTAVEEALGESGLVQENLDNVVDVGTAIFNANAMDKYVKSLVNRIGKTIFVNRPYNGGSPKGVLRDAWEFGSVLCKVAADLPEASENESWELVNGNSYDPNIFYKPSVYAKFYNDKTTFEIPMSFTEIQVKQSFTSVTELNAFISMLQTSIEDALTVCVDELIMRTINNMTAETLYTEYGGSGYDADSKVKAVNLLYLYNQTVTTPLTVDEAMISPEFIRYSAYIINLYAARMRKMSTLFNMGGKHRYTPNERRITVLHSDFVAAAKSFLYSGTYHDEFVALPDKYDEVAYWQGSGTDFAFDDTSKIDVVTASGHAVELSGIIGVMFDRDALGVCNYDRRVTQNFNPKAEFYTEFVKQDAHYFNDFNENAVCFFLAESEGE